MVAYAALREFIPLFPVYALLFADTGLGAGQISSLFVIWSATHVILEVPSGALADTRSRRGLLVVAALVYGACFALWTATPSYPAFAGGFVLWGAASSLVSGTYESYVYDQLSARDQLARYRSLIAAGQSAALVLNLVATVLATPLLAWWGYAGVGWASVAVCVASAGLAATLPPDGRRHIHVGNEVGEIGHTVEEARGYAATLRRGLDDAFAPAVVAAVMLAAFLPAFLAFDEYFPLLAADLGTPAEVVPILIATTVAGQAIGAALAPRLRPERLRAVIVVAAVLVGAGSMSGSPWGFAGIAVGYGLLQATIVVAETDLQHRIDGPARATVTSVAGLLSELGAIGLYAAVAAGSAIASMSAIVAAIAGVLCVGAAVIRTRNLHHS